MRHYRISLAIILGLIASVPAMGADPPATVEPLKKVQDAVTLAQQSADIAWMLASSGLVMFMVPGLALFYGGMVRRKNVLATMMQSMVALSLVGVYWIAIGYCLAFGQTRGGYIGWSPEKLLFLRGVAPDEILPGTNIPVYVHVMFQGMFAIITPALISGALAERIRFGPYCLFILLWVTFVYCPLAHWVWAMNWWDAADAGTKLVGWLGNPDVVGALDFAGGTVVHIAAGLSGLAAILVVRKRIGYPEHAFHPNSMVLTLLGAGLLWFGWFGFNGGSALGSNALAGSAFTATQAAAAAAGFSWMMVEWFHKGKPTALGLASGIVAGLVAVTPASGFVLPWGGLSIGLLAGLICYGSVCLKQVLGYDDSLDAFGVHGVGGFLGAVLTGVFCYKSVNAAGADGLIASGSVSQVIAQVTAAGTAVVFSFVGSLILIKMLDVLCGFTCEENAEVEGLDQTEHGEVGFNFGPSLEAAPENTIQEPRSALLPPNGEKRFAVAVEGASTAELLDTWSQLCQASASPPSPQFRSIYPYMTVVEGNRFRFRGGDPKAVSENLRQLFQDRLAKADIRTHIENQDVGHS